MFINKNFRKFNLHIDRQLYTCSGFIGNSGRSGTVHRAFKLVFLFPLQ